jgi:uncharacterized membrane protein YgdD (TMEM256/DUF423 family)
MNPSAKLFLLLGALNAASAVLLGAFGAHGLKKTLSIEMLQVYQTGVQYHFYHALGLLVLGVLAVHLGESVLLKWSGWAMFGGVILFSGSLYVLSVSGIKGLGAITPFGGLLFVAAWVLLALAVWMNKSG